MITIIKSFLWIMVFRQGPDALPVSAFLARACIVINVLVSALTNIILLTQEPWSVTLIRTLLILLINILLIWTVLRLRSFSHRFTKQSAPSRVRCFDNFRNTYFFIAFRVNRKFHNRPSHRRSSSVEYFCLRIYISSIIRNSRRNRRHQRLYTNYVLL